VGGLIRGVKPVKLIQVFGHTLFRMRFAVLAISGMLGLGFVTRYSGTDAVLGLAFTHTGWFFPFFGTFLGWLGVALTGSDTSSNALFGSLQRITAEQLHLDPILMTAANSAGGVMGKMVDAQSICVATAATNQLGNEGMIFRFVFWHSIALGAIVGVIVMLYAYVFPYLVPHGLTFIHCCGKLLCEALRRGKQDFRRAARNCRTARLDYFARRTAHLRVRRADQFSCAAARGPASGFHRTSAKNCARMSPRENSFCRARLRNRTERRRAAGGKRRGDQPDAHEQNPGSGFRQRARRRGTGRD